MLADDEHATEAIDRCERSLDGLAYVGGGRRFRVPREVEHGERDGCRYDCRRGADVRKARPASCLRALTLEAAAQRHEEVVGVLGHRKALQLRRQQRVAIGHRPSLPSTSAARRAARARLSRDATVPSGMPRMLAASE